VLRDIFAYKPSITKDQFFVKGFVERKVIMCTKILEMVKKKNNQLNPAPVKTSMKTSVRPKSADPILNVPRTRQSEGGKVSPRGQDRNSDTQSVPRQPLQIVNELLAEPGVEPVRHMSHTASHGTTVRHVASHSPGNWCLKYQITPF